MKAHDSRGHDPSIILTEQLKALDLLASLVHFKFTLEAFLRYSFSFISVLLLLYTLA